MIDKIEDWINRTLDNSSDKVESCKVLLPTFKGFYPEEFLSRSYCVIVDKIV